MAGVGTTPALVTVAPSPDAPCASSASIQTPDSRVSRPTSSRGASAPDGSARTKAAPSRRTVGGSSGWRPAIPRTPSVPKRRGIVESVFATGDSYLDDRRLDVRDTGVARRLGANRQRVVAGTETIKVNIRGDVVGLRAAERAAIPAQADIDGRG